MMFSNTSEHFVSWAKSGQAVSYQMDVIKWHLKKQTFAVKMRRSFSIWFGERLFSTSTEAVKTVAGTVVKRNAQKVGHERNAQRRNY